MSFPAQMRRAIHTPSTATLAGLLLALWSCGPALPDVATAVDAEPPRIELSPADRPGWWRVRWLFPRPVRSLRFEREARSFRHSQWHIVTAGYRFAPDGGDDVELAEGADAVREIVAELPIFSEHLPKEYELFRTFTDGSVAIYTGHLYLDPTYAGAAAPESPEVVELRVVPPPGQTVVLQGEIHRGPAVWRDRTGKGTYVYFGSIEPVETEAMTSVVDPGLPDWVRDPVADLLPRLWAELTEGLGVDLSSKPFVLLSYDGTADVGMSSGGGTLPGMVQISLEGRGWEERSDEALLRLVHLLAHESVHLWNGEAFTFSSTAASWMHEGSADAIADRLLVSLGLIDEAQLWSRRTVALNECAAWLDLPLDRSAERGLWRNYYTCGQMLALWTEGALHRQGADIDLFGFWRALLEASKAHDRVYSEDLYLQTLGGFGVPDDVLAELRAVTQGPVDDAVAALLGGLRRAGLDVEVAPDDAPPTFEYHRELARKAFIELMKGDCDGSYSFWTRPDHLEVAEMPKCRTLGGPVEVIAVAGRPVLAEGGEVYDAVRAACAEGRPVEVGTRTGELRRVECTAELPPRPPWMHLRGWASCC